MPVPHFQQNKLLSELSTFGIGGPAQYFVEARSIEDMQDIIRQCKQEQLRYLVVGKGSNSLFDDRGFKGLVILNKIDFLEKSVPGVYHVGAGYSFSLLGSQTARQGYEGLEFASGIPGSVGGAVYMNAGANGTETCETLTSVDYIDEEGDLKVIEKKDLHFSYRHSSFQNMKGVIVGATFTLAPSSIARQKQLEIISYRTKTQPYSDKSAGCIFRNPDCGHAGAMIDKAGLKGRSIGGAKISEMHANFIVNTGTATCKDVLALIQQIKTILQINHGVHLESEVRVFPYEEA